MGVVVSQTSDVIYQMDILLNRLNSHNTVQIGDIIANNTIMALESLNSDYTQNVTKDIMNHLRDILVMINSQDTKDLIHNLKTFTDESKFYVDLNDNKLGSVIILFEILLVLLIIFSFFILTMCVLKLLMKKNNKNNILNDVEVYNPINNPLIIPLNQENRIEDNLNDPYTS